MSLAMPARYALEREDWKAAAALPVPSAPAFGEAVVVFARALGAARSGDAAAADLIRKGFRAYVLAGVESDAPMDQTMWQVAEYRHGKTIGWRFFTSEAEALEVAGLRE